MDLFADLPLLDERRHAEFRWRMQEILQGWLQANAALLGLQARALEHPNQPVSAADAQAMKGFEKHITDSMRLARESAAAYHTDLAVADLATWERLIDRAQVVFSGALAKVRLDREAWRKGRAVPNAVGHAAILVAWAFCDAPIALRVMRAGSEAEAAAR